MSKRDDMTNDMTLPVNALGDAFDHTDVRREFDESLHAWAEGQVFNGSQPSQTHMFRINPQVQYHRRYLPCLKNGIRTKIRDLLNVSCSVKVGWRSST